MARDVDLVIRAKDQAKKAIDSVAAALQDLTDVQKDVGQSAAKTDGLLGRLRNELTNLDKEARGLAALNKVASQLDRAATAVGRLDAAAARAVDEQKKLSAAAGDAAANTARLSAAALEAKAAYDRQKAAVAALTAEERKNVATVTAARQQRDALRASMSEANAALRVAQRQEAALSQQVLDAAASVEKQTAALAEANGELTEIASMANKVSAALGGVEATQDAVAAASVRAAADIERLNAALARQESGGGPRAAPTSAAGATSAYRDQIAAVTQAKVAWREAQEEANRLGAAIARTAEPTREMQTAFLLAQKASKDAKAEYVIQGAALNDLRGDLAAARTATAALAQEQTEGAGAATKAAVAQRQFAGASRAAADANARAVTENLRLAQAFEGIYGESRKSMNLFQRLRGEVLSLAAAYIGLYAAIGAMGSVISAQQQIEAAQSRLGVIFGQNSARVAVEINWLRSEAQRLGITFATLADEYGKFAFAAQAANFTNEDTRKIFMSVAESARVMKVSAEDTGGLFKALTQIMSKGKVQAEELRGQLGDRMSGAFQIFAAAIGVTTGQLEEMLEKGEVIANRSTLLGFADELRKRFGPQLAGSLDTTTAEIGKLSANIFEAEKRIGDGGFWAGLGEALRELNVWFRSDDGKKFFDDLGAALGKFVGILPALIDNFGLLTTMFQVFTALKVAEVFVNLFNAAGGKVGNFGVVVQAARAEILGMAAAMQLAAGAAGAGALGTALKATTATIVGMRGALIAGAAAFKVFWAAVGGWPTVIISLLTFIVQHLLGKWLVSVDGLTDALQEHRRITDKVSEGYVNAKGEVDSWRKALEDLTATEIELNTTKLQKQLDGLRKDAIEALTDSTSGTFSYFTKGEEKQAFQDLIFQFKRGEISAKAFKAEIDRLAQANPNLDRTLVEPLLQVAMKAIEAEDALAKNTAALRAKKGVATEADKALLGLAGALEEVAASADTSAIDKYTAALKQLGEAVPDIKAQMELDTRRADIDTAYQTAVKSALGSGAESEIIQDMLRQALERKDAALKALSDELSAEKGNYRDKVVGRESGGNRFAKAGTSSATGLHQFTEGTWLKLFRQHFPEMASGMTKAAILALRTDPKMSDRMFDLLTEANAKMLVDAGYSPTDTNKYLAHFLGISDTLKVLGVGTATPIQRLVQPDSIAANPSVFKKVKTAGDMVGWSAQKMGASGAEVAATQQINDLLTERQQAQAELNAEVATGISQRRFEVEQMSRSATEQAVQTELRQLETQAMQANLPVLEAGSRLTAEQTAQVRASVTARLDAENAQKRLNTLEQLGAEIAEAKGVVESEATYVARRARELGIDALDAENAALLRILGSLYRISEAQRQGQALDAVASSFGQQQQGLQEQIEFSQNMGDAAAVETLRAKLAEVQLAYMAALTAARDFWALQDPATNPQAATAVMQYDMLIAKQKAVGTQAVATGRQINDSFASGFAQAFDAFARSIDEGANAFEGMRDSFLSFAADFMRQIAAMIMQALILKALTGDATGGGGGLGGWIAGKINAAVAHQGGIAGQSTGTSRSVWSGAWANALRYHGGGLAGFKPDEVPVIAKRGEELVPDDDPRHRANGGLGGTSLAVRVMNLIDAAQIASLGLASEAGEKAVMNVIGNRSDEVKALLG